MKAMASEKPSEPTPKPPAAAVKSPTTSTPLSVSVTADLRAAVLRAGCRGLLNASNEARAKKGLPLLPIPPDLLPK